LAHLVKVTRLGHPKPLMSLTGLLGGSMGGPSGQVPTSDGSNTVSWGSNIATIWANGSNQVLGPHVNFASGSNITFAVASNTLTIHGQAGGGASALTIKDEGTPLTTDATTLDFTGAGVTASGTGVTKTINIPGGGGSSLSVPDVVQAASNGNAATSVTIAAASSGNRLIMFTNSTTGQVTSPTCTNVTWTQIKTHSGAGAFYAIWVGVVAGGVSGTSITMTKPGSFNTVLVLEVTDALTPTAGANTAANTIGITGTGSNLFNFRRLSGTTSGRFVVFASGADNTALLMRVRTSVPTAGVSVSIGCTMLVGYAVGSSVSMDTDHSAVGAQLITEVT
jgi:hypothetical protein